MNVRSRLVTKQINTSKEQRFFAATPPREGIRMLLSATVAGNKPKVFMINDVSRAYMHARTSSDIYAELCEEDRTGPRDENRCGKLIKSMYETPAAAHDWQSEVTRTMTELRFKQGEASPCVFDKEISKRSGTGTTSCHLERERNLSACATADVRDEDDHGGRRRRPGQGGESAVWLHKQNGPCSSRTPS